MIYSNHLPTLFILSLLLLGCAAPVKERVNLPGELTGWKLGHKTQDRLTSSVRWEHIREGEYISKWSRMYTVQFHDTKQTDLSRFMVELLSKQAQKCPTIAWNILEKQAQRVLYEWRSMGCKRFKEQHELAIIIRGTGGIHRVAYTEKRRNIAKQNYEAWKKKLLGASLDSGSK